METLFENVFPLLILFLVVGWWILRGIFKVVRRSVVGMDEEVDVGPVPDEPTPARIRALTSIEEEMRNPLAVPDTPAEAPQIGDLPSIEDLARDNRRARDRMREEMPDAVGLGDGTLVGDVASDVIIYPQGSESMVAEAWARIYGDDWSRD